MSDAWGGRIRVILLDVAIGCVFAIANFSGIIRHIGESEAAVRLGLTPVLLSVAQLPKSTLGTSTSTLYIWLMMCFWGLWLYLGMVVVLALVRANAGIAGVGIGGLVLGVFILPGLSWIAIVIGAIFWLIGWIFHLFRIICEAIGEAIGWLLQHIWPVLLVAAVLGVLIFAWKKLGPLRLLIGVAGIAVLYALGPVFRSLWENILLPFCRWLRWLVGVVAGWVGFVLLWVAKVAAVLFAISAVIGFIGSFGCLLVDQMRTAWEAGRSRKGVLLGSFSLGTSLGLILLVASGSPEVQNPSVIQPVMLQQSGAPTVKSPMKKGKKKGFKKKVDRSTPVYIPPPPPPPLSATVDDAWRRGGWILGGVSLTKTFAATLPTAVHEWAKGAFRNASAPLFDAFVLSLAIFITVLGAVRGIFARKEIPLEIRFHNRDLLALVALPLFIVALVISASDSNT